MIAFSCLIVVATGFIGSNIVHAASGDLSNTSSVWSGGANDANVSTTVGITGWYEVSLAAGGGHRSGGFIDNSGKMKAYIKIDENSVLRVQKFLGGYESNNYTGGDSIMLFCNNNPIFGVGGGSGASWTNTYRSTDRIANTYFSSGANSGNGDGSTIPGCNPAQAAVEDPGWISNSPGNAGQNYFKSGYIIEQPNNSDILAWSVKYAAANDQALVSKIPNKITPNCVVTVTDQNKIYAVTEDSTHLIRIESGSGRVIQGWLKLKKNDIVEYGRVHNARSYIRVNQEVVILSGTTAILNETTNINVDIFDTGLSDTGTTDTYINTNFFELTFTDTRMGGSSKLTIGESLLVDFTTYDLPIEKQISVMTDVSRIYVAPEDFLYNIKAQALNGDTISCDLNMQKGDTLHVIRLNNGILILKNKYTPVLISSSPGGNTLNEGDYPGVTNPQSWVNRDITTRIQHTPTSAQAFMVTITCKSIFDDFTIGDVGDQVAGIFIELNELKDLIKGMGSATPTVYVSKGEYFEKKLAVYDDMDSISQGSLTVTNSDKTDGFIILKGTFNQEGSVEVMLGGKLFIFECVVEPTSTTVTVLF